MKDYIYLDEDLLNSTLAQLDSGLLQGFSETDEQGSSHSDTSEESLSKGLEGVLQVGARYVKEVTDKSGMELTKSQTRALDYALNDYAVDVLLDKIKLLDNYTDKIAYSEEGDLINYQSEFSLYDFSFMKEVSDDEIVEIFFGQSSETEEIKKIEDQIKILNSRAKNDSSLRLKVKELKSELKDLKDNYKSAKEGFELINKAATVADKVLGESIFVKAENSLSLCKREYFRLNKGQLALLTETNREIKILGIVSAIKSEMYRDGLPAFKPADMNKIPGILTDIFLSSFRMINQGDRIITPIAIFFE